MQFIWRGVFVKPGFTIWRGGPYPALEQREVRGLPGYPAVPRLELPGSVFRAFIFDFRGGSIRHSLLCWFYFGTPSVFLCRGRFPCTKEISTRVRSSRARKPYEQEKRRGETELFEKRGWSMKCARVRFPACPDSPCSCLGVCGLFTAHSAFSGLRATQFARLREKSRFLFPPTLRWSLRWHPLHTFSGRLP